MLKNRLHSAQKTLVIIFMREPRERIEIMAPAGSLDSMTAAINAGADSIYFGVEQLNMRAKAANNLTVEQLPEIVATCNAANVKTYLTLNTLMYQHDMPLMKKICDTAKDAGLTAVIASDLAAVTYAHSIGLEVHISTQQSVANYETVEFFSKYADVVVLAREVTLKQVKQIHDNIIENDLRGPKGELMQIELFAHGALCIAISGKCYMSLHTQNSSANRGACKQNCRHAYKVTDVETGDELVVDNEYIMSPKDLCTIGFIDKILDSGVCVLKLEGRGRSPDYVKTVTRCYKEAVDAVYEGTYSEEKIQSWITDLEKVYNRGFWHGGYYHGKQLGIWSGAYGSQSTHENIFLGRATKYFQKAGIGEFHMETGDISIGDELLITGPTTGAINVLIEELYVDGEPSKTAKKGDMITIKVPERVRSSDKLFVVRERKTKQ